MWIKCLSKGIDTIFVVTHCGLVTSFGYIDLDQHWLRQWIVAWRHQAITRTNGVLPQKVFCGIHLRKILQGVLMNLKGNMSSDITLFLFTSTSRHSVNLTHWGWNKMAAIFQITFSKSLLWKLWILIQISLRYIPTGPINNHPALV